MKRSPEVKYEGDPSVKIPQGLLVEVAKAKRLNECFTCDERLAPPIPVSPELPDVPDAKRLNQEVVSAAEKSLLLPSPASSVASMPPTSATPTGPPPAYSLPRSSLELEFRLCWKPPDCEEESKRHACYAVNNRPQPSVTKHLPLPGAAPMLSTSRFSLAYITQAIPSRRQSLPSGWRVRILPAGVEIAQRRAVRIANYNIDAGAEKHSPMSAARFTPPKCQHASAWADFTRLLNVELIWRARSKPPNATDTTQQHSARVISARVDASIKRSSFCKAIPILPIHPLVCFVRVINPCRPNNELVWRARKPPDEAEPWLLDEAVNNVERETRWGCLSRSWPAFTSSPASSTRTANPCRPNDELVGRVREPPEAMEYWLLEEAISKIGNGGERRHSPVSRPTSAFYARSPNFWPVLASPICCSCCEALIVQRASGKG
ncbi:hypothetical protein AX14_006647 [Amanita brunnescens Koide BX004]|nr:hypothetical protein AX14_006647 [Amanita brunnescens Koide BX004]